MIFTLIKQKFGTSGKTIISKLDLNTKINDFCFLENKGFIFATDDGVALLTNDNKFTLPWVQNIKTPKAICFQEEKQNFYVVDGYKNIKYFSLHNPNGFEVMGENNKCVFNKYLSKTKDEGCVVSCSANKNGQVYFIHSGLNRCLKVDGKQTIGFLGNGRSGFSVASRLSGCQINEPKGVCCHGKDIYISDTKNNCIRKVSADNTIRIVIGHPNICSEEFKIEPSKIVVKNNLIYFIDNNFIKYSTFNNTDSGQIYRAENHIISLDVGKDKSLYILLEE